MTQTVDKYTVRCSMSIQRPCQVRSAHNKGGREPRDKNIAQILHLSNIFELKRTLVYIHLQLRTRKVLDVQLVYLNLQI